jgi:hypothetical protein
MLFAAEMARSRSFSASYDVTPGSAKGEFAPDVRLDREE